jgi:RNA polymerase sigma factor (sigma-70 family)
MCGPLRRSYRRYMDAKTHQKSPADLVRAARRGEHPAWNALVRRYTPQVRRIAADHRLQPHDADDVVQSCWLALLESLPTLRDPEAVGAWLVTAARRQSLRTRRRLERDVLVDTVLREDHDGRDSTVGAAVAGARARELTAAVQRLPTRQRRLLEALTTYPEPSYAEVSQRLGLPRGSIGPTRARGLERLRRDARLRAAIAA